MRSNYQHYLLLPYCIFNDCKKDEIIQIRAATEEAANAHNDAISLSKWENAIENLKIQINFARDN